MVCCLNPTCDQPENPEGITHCQSCGTKLIERLRDRYRPTNFLGEGGFGRTYRGEDIDRLNASCVIKQLAAKVQGTWALKKAIELFEQEAQRMQALGENNPHIPTLYAYFEEDQQLYLVQEYIEGQNLLQELQSQGLWNEKQIKNLLLELLPILQNIHSKQVIHRDIKPENIMRRSRSGSKGEFVLIDFGVSKQLSATAQVTTQIGTCLGSFGYASFEQIQAGEAYPASDLFSLGATCFHLLTGIVPQELWLKQGYSWTEKWQDYLKQPLKDPQLKQVLNQFLKEDWQARYLSAEAALETLNQKTVSPPQSTVVKSPSKSKSKPIPPPPKINTTVIQQTKSKTPVKPITSPPQPTPKKLGFKLFISLFLVGSFIGMGSSLYLVWKFQLWKYIDAMANILSQGNLTTSNPSPVEPSVAVTNPPPPILEPTPLASPAVTPTLEPTPLASPTVVTPTLEPTPLASPAVTVSPINTTPPTPAVVPPPPKKPSPVPVSVTPVSWVKPSKIHSFIGHSEWVHSVAFSPDAKTLASGSNDTTVKLWDVIGQVRMTLTGHSFYVNSVAFSPDSKILASGSEDTTIKLWEVETGKLIVTLTTPGVVNSVKFSPDGKILVAGIGDNTIKLFDVTTGKQLANFTGHLAPVTSVAFSPDGNTLASGSEDRNVKLWEVSTGKLQANLTGSKNVKSIAFSPDGNTLASGGSGSTIQIWDVATGKILASLQTNQPQVLSLAFSPDGTTLASTDYGEGYLSTIQLWNLATQKPIAQFEGRSFLSISFSPDGKLLSVGGMRIIDVWQGQ
ncbi:serine/threonine-protein kinase [Planktothrix agardhii]|jgi:serine/threonine protein kinase/Tol biopolymer transport system component|uniref:serine/threonine-protein kinase n=1 Tax=Planktothrix agardhii TaxID=1160 RepID=UPI001D0A7B10|nr:serine/threonine-protein kinase [Planktothrix agardhii]MCB8760057.1 serine/threonine protein kinase [Planktothrix agardhii 1813]